MVSLDEEELVKWFTKPGLKPIRKAKLAKGHSQLDFPSESARRHQLAHCKRKIEENCLQGARKSCSLRALGYCRPNWVHSLLNFLGRGSPSTRISESCQDDFMKECMHTSEFECKRHAHSFCETSYTS